MNLKQLITPKNEDGSVDHRYIPIAQSIVDLAGERVEAQLRKLYAATTNLEKESASAGLQLVIALFSIPMDERFERSKFKKHIREQLQEIGFKPSKVSKLMGAGEFYADYSSCTFNSDFDLESTEDEYNEKRERFLGEYFNNISKLYELSRMNGTAIHRVSTDLARDNKVYSQAELEKLRQIYPKDVYERRGRKPNRHHVQETNLLPSVVTHESLKVMEDAAEENVTRQPESAHSLISRFFTLVASGVIEQRLAEYTPAAQAHLIDEIKTGITLLEDFVSKNKTVEVTSVN
ncbi:MAG: hypothetical protein CMN50_00105 [SAR116 cluster bacterium]|nr:hypothetical protein [SAR116 cluster bacterium]